jgi:uncharacterized protein
VLPKGNIEAGLSAAAAAALEAEEEAGIRGHIAATPVGAYRYLKTRCVGSTMIDVDVFPLAVVEELPDWKERSERERRWFSLTGAADAVDEPELKTLIRNFRPPIAN